MVFKKEDGVLIKVLGQEKGIHVSSLAFDKDDQGTDE